MLLFLLGGLKGNHTDMVIVSSFVGGGVGFKGNQKDMVTIMFCFCFALGGLLG